MVLLSYDPESTMRDARARYFEANGFGADGGYHDAWVTLMMGPIPVSFPNSKERVRALRCHDLHHVITAYDTDFVGEFEISAWEIAAGCKDFWVAWALNLAGTAGGVFRAPARTFRAFVRGRHSRSLYGLDAEALLHERVREVRARMGLERAEDARARASDVLLFVLSVLVGFVLGLCLLGFGAIAGPFVLAYGHYKRPRPTKLGDSPSIPAQAAPASAPPEH